MHDMSTTGRESEGNSTGVRPPARGRSGFVDSDGVRIHYLEYGTGGPDVLLIPGLSCPAVTYETVSVALADEFHVVCIDLRGRGLSDVPADGYTLPDYAADVAAVIDAAGLVQPVVVGHALGARIVPAFDVLHPGVAGALLIADPPSTGPGRPPYSTPLESFQSQLAEAREGITADDVRRYFPDWDQQALELRALWLDTCDSHAVSESYRNFQREDFFGYLAAARTPGLFVYGERTHAVPAAALEELRASNDRLTFVEVPDTGHMIPFENLPAFLEQIRAAATGAAGRERSS
jgi:N-formylmaleamate deformylase